MNSKRKYATAAQALDNFSKSTKAIGKAIGGKSKTGLGRHELKNVGDLETAFHREYGIRMVIRLHPKTTIKWTGTQVHDLSDKVSNDFTAVRTVAQLRAAIREYVRPYRGGVFAEGIDLEKAEIEFIGKAGVVASGNTLVKNIRFGE
jgi:hypothetical protein